jgi:hypothetical protein
MVTRTIQLLLICIALTIPCTSIAQNLPDILLQEKDKSPVTKEDHLNIFFSECSSYEHSVYNQAYQEYLCGCMTARMQDDFTLQDAQSLFKNTRAGYAATDRMWIRHYASCMPETTQNLVKDTCLEMLGQQTQIKKVNAVCSCKGKTVHRMVSSTIQDSIQWTLTNTKTRPTRYEDIMKDYFAGYGFKDDDSDSLRHCIYREEYGWKRGR